MKLTLHRSNYFNQDFELQYRWYLENANEEVTERYFGAVLMTLRELCLHPGVGRLRTFRHSQLRGLRSFCIQRPFQTHLIFYRHTESELIVERIMHGARNLPRRLSEPPKE